MTTAEMIRTATAEDAEENQFDRRCAAIAVRVLPGYAAAVRIDRPEDMKTANDVLQANRVSYRAGARINLDGTFEGRICIKHAMDVQWAVDLFYLFDRS